MADFDNRLARGATTATDSYDAGLRAYMLRVYNYMLLGLVVTGLASAALYMLSVTSDPSSAAGEITRGVYLTQLGATLFLSPLRWVVLFSPLALALYLQVRISRMSVGGALTGFVVYAGLIGASIGTISMLVYTGASIAQVFFITAAALEAATYWVR